VYTPLGAPEENNLSPATFSARAKLLLARARGYRRGITPVIIHKAVHKRSQKWKMPGDKTSRRCDRRGSFGV
jgi:hypothetical protein